ncbi:hypothetical protein B0T19DRAFT_247404 [Cercophora scortea]|uniref:Secreted protein n=1 Tax=Cercophora scortea TaxID=314031 RepID=A0AAE0I938_9PEZI|nr:hypothetical protein B0T19DRAFT_247404 [Cercophora scortea]
MRIHQSLFLQVFLLFPNSSICMHACPSVANNDASRAGKYGPNPRRARSLSLLIFPLNLSFHARFMTSGVSAIYGPFDSFSFPPTRQPDSQIARQPNNPTDR